MNGKTIGAAVAAVMLAVDAVAAYDVRMPSFRPQLRGAVAGKWTMDYAAAISAAKEEGECTIVLVTGSWWCPHCEAFEEKVINSDEWRRFLEDRGYYLAVLDFPYRGHVKDEEIGKSAHPELGDGWGFQCWLYDADFLAENSLTVEDGYREIQKLYELQKSLAPESAQEVTIKTWDGKDFTYGKVGYPTLIVYLPDGTEAGRFVPFVTYMDAVEARKYVMEQLEAIVSAALDSQCGLCSDPDSGDVSGDVACCYRGWLKAASGAIAGTVEVKTSRQDSKGWIKAVASVKMGGKTIRLKGRSSGRFETIALYRKEKDPRQGQAVLRLSTHGLAGSYVEANGTSFDVLGARDVYDKETVAGTGNWSIVMQPTDGAAADIRGNGVLSIKIKNGGKASIVGYMGDGKRFSVSSRVIVGEDGVYCLPVSADLYAKKQGGFGCTVWFKDGKIFNVKDIRPWSVPVGKAFATVNWRPIISPCAGCGEIPDEMEFEVQDLEEGSLVDGNPLVSGDFDDEISVKGSKWTGTSLSHLKAKCDKKTGLVTGSSRLTVLKAGKPRQVPTKIVGIVANGSCYGTMIVRGQGSYAIRISSCSACSD